MSNKAYDILKFIAQIFLPAVGTLYFALAGYWGLPNSEAVVGSIMAVDAFLGALLGLSSKSYNGSEAKYDGRIDVHENEDGVKNFSMQLLHLEDPMEIANKKEVVFKVNPQG